MLDGLALGCDRTPLKIHATMVTTLFPEKLKQSDEKNHENQLYCVPISDGYYRPAS